MKKRDFCILAVLLLIVVGVCVYYKGYTALPQSVFGLQLGNQSLQLSSEQERQINSILGKYKRSNSSLGFSGLENLSENTIRFGTGKGNITLLNGNVQYPYVFQLGNKMYEIKNGEKLYQEIRAVLNQ